MLLEPPLHRPQIPVANLDFGTSKIGQEAYVTRTIIDVLPDGCMEVAMVTKTIRYDLKEDGTFGEPLPAAYQQPDLVPPLVANGQCAVSPEGEVRYRLVTPNSARNMRTGELEEFAPGQAWRQFLHAKPEDLLLQDRFFGLLATTTEKSVVEIMLGNMMQANAEPSVYAVQQPR